MTEVDKIEDTRSFLFKVNGIEIEAKRPKILVSAVLDLAAERGAMPGKPEDYILQGDKGPYKSDDWVNLEEDNQFITIPNTPTPVA